MAAAKGISMDVAVATVLSELVGIFALKGEKKIGFEGFRQWKRCYWFTLLWLWQEFRCGSPQGNDTPLVSPLTPIESFEMLPPGSAGRKKSD